MATLTIHFPDEKHNTRFKAVAATGNAEKGLRILAKLDALTE